jgi:hypothetical protein
MGIPQNMGFLTKKPANIYGLWGSQFQEPFRAPFETQMATLNQDSLNQENNMLWVN